MKTLRERSLESASFGATLRRRRTRRPRGKSELDRLLQIHSGSLTFLGLTLGVFVSRKFFMIPLAVAVSLAQEVAKQHLLGAQDSPV